MATSRRRDAWVFLKGRTVSGANGATVELVERHLSRRAGQGGSAGGPYAWVTFPETPHGAYTVRVTYPSGAAQTARLIVDGRRHAVTLDEPAAP
jgi:hypothetical protein